jgi:hypothetical protein
MTLEAVMSQWLFDHCINVTTATGSYSEDTVTGTTTAHYQIEIESGITEDLDAVIPPMLSGTVNHPDLDPDLTYILTASQAGGEDVEYNFSPVSTTSSGLDWLVKIG